MASEQDFNIKFVLEVEKYPCLYNYNLPEYVRKDLVEKAWNELGKKVNLTGHECKEKWRNIRNVFVRNLKPAKGGSGNKKKPYYLNYFMQFALPFVNKMYYSPVSGNLPIPTNQHDDCIIDGNSNEEGNNLSFGRQQSQFKSLDSQSTRHPFPKDAQTKAVQIQPSPSSQFPQSPPSLQSRALPTSSSPQSMTGPSSSRSDTSRPSKKKGRKSDSNIEYFKAKQAKKDNILEQNPKKMFLLSLLPDLEPMTDEQMRVFKRQVMQVIEEIFNDRPLTPSMENSDTALFYENITSVAKAEPDDSNSENDDDDLS